MVSLAGHGRRVVGAAVVEGAEITFLNYNLILFVFVFVLMILWIGEYVIVCMYVSF